MHVRCMKLNIIKDPVVYWSVFILASEVLAIHNLCKRLHLL